MIEIGAGTAAEIIACALIAAAAAILLYRRTTPTIPRRLRTGLGVGRWLAIFLLLLLALDPVIWVKRTESSQPVVVVLIDDSMSMVRPTAEAKLDEVKTALTSGVMESLARRASVRAFTFSDRAVEVGPSELPDITARGSRTDLVSGLEFALDRLDNLPSDIVIVSDGGVNFGKDAVHFCMGLRVPVHTLSAAKSPPTSDVSIDRLEFSELAYAGSDIPVEVYFSGRGDSPVETRLTVSDSAGAVHSEAVTIPGSGARVRKSVRINAGETGLHKFSVELGPLEGEEVASNNTMAFSLRVIKGNLKVCLIAPGPSWDFAFTRRNLMADPNMEVFVLFPPGAGNRVNLPNAVSRLGAVQDLDAVVVIRSPGSQAAADAIRDFVGAGGGLLAISPEGWSGALAALNPFLTETGPQSPPQVTAAVTEAGVAHEIMNIGGTFRADLWADLPPLPLSSGAVEKKREAEALMASEKKPGVPVMAIMKYGGGKVCAFSCSELWRWDLVAVGFGVDVPVYRGLLGSAIKWLVRREEAERVSITSPRVDYLWGEPVDLVVRVVDENMRGLPDAVLEGEIVKEETGETAGRPQFEERGPGTFSARIDFLPPGRYTAAVTARSGGSAVGTDVLSFGVEGRGLEDKGFDGDRVMLEEISSVTGGMHYGIENAAELARSINPGEVVVNRLDEVRFELGLGTFAFILVLLGLEWLIRKRRMLP